MRKDVVLVSAYETMDRAQQMARLLAAEDWRVSIVAGQASLEEIEDQDDALTLVLMSMDAAFSPFVRPWIERAPRDRMAILSFVDSLPTDLHDAVVFDFRGWRGDRAQLWRSLTRWLEAPHARLDTRVWLKRA